jgi:hypothetical protein
MSNENRDENDIIWFLILSGLGAIMWFGSMLYYLVGAKHQ